MYTIHLLPVAGLSVQDTLTLSVNRTLTSCTLYTYPCPNAHTNNPLPFQTKIPAQLVSHRWRNRILPLIINALAYKHLVVLTLCIALHPLSHAGNCTTMLETIARNPNGGAGFGILLGLHEIGKANACGRASDLYALVHSLYALCGEG